MRSNGEFRNICFSLPKNKVAKFVMSSREVYKVKKEPVYWPIQMQCVNTEANYFNEVHLLIVADCVGYGYPDFHYDFFSGKPTIMGCPKLDHEDYTKRLLQIFNLHHIYSVTLTCMEVPCCKVLKTAVEKAIQLSQQNIPLAVIMISCKGKSLLCQH